MIEQPLLERLFIQSTVLRDFILACISVGLSRMVEVSIQSESSFSGTQPAISQCRRLPDTAAEDVSTNAGEDLNPVSRSEIERGLSLRTIAFAALQEATAEDDYDLSDLVSLPEVKDAVTWYILDESMRSGSSVMREPGMREKQWSLQQLSSCHQAGKLGESPIQLYNLGGKLIQFT